MREVKQDPPKEETTEIGTKEGIKEAGMKETIEEAVTKVGPDKDIVNKDHVMMTENRLYLNLTGLVLEAGRKDVPNGPNSEKSA